MVIQEPATEPDEEPGRSGRQQRSRSRERAPAHVPPSADEESATVEPQNRVSDRSRSPQTTKGEENHGETRKHHKTNLELLQTLSLQYLCYLTNPVPEEEIQWVDTSDQLPVHKVHRRPVHKDHRPVPALRMNPLTTMTRTEKENLPQQYKAHEVMTQEGQCSTQTLMF